MTAAVRPSRLLLLAAALAAAAGARAAAPVPLPTAEQLAWSEAEVGCMISFGITTSVHEQGCVEGGHLPPSPGVFAPVALNVSQWIEAAASFGARYCVMVAQHSCGFAMSPSEITLPDGEPYNYTVAQSSPSWARSDIVSEFVEACERAGVRPGLYYQSVRNALLNVNFGRVQGGPLRPPQRLVTQEQYEAVVLAQVAELWGRFPGRLYELWFDGGYTASLRGNMTRLVARLQPQAVAFGGLGISQNPIRWVGDETGVAGVPNWSTGSRSGAGSASSPVWNPAEADTTAQRNDQWFYNEAAGERSLADLVSAYHTTVGRNSNLLLNLAPRPDGTLAPAAVARYAELGRWIEACYGAPPVAAAPRNATVLPLPAGAVFDRVSLREDQSRGQLVRNYTLDVQHDAGGAWTPVANGTSVGNRAIVRLPRPVERAAAVRVRVGALNGVWHFSEFAVYSCTDPVDDDKE